MVGKYVTIIIRGLGGSVPEWLMGADCKSAGYAYAGSNPARPTTTKLQSEVYPVAERSLGEKDQMSGILTLDFDFFARVAQW